MDKRECDLLIIGSGPAGMMAAVYAARARLNTLILETTGAGGQVLSTNEIDNFPGIVTITGAELAMKMNEQVESCGVETIYDEIASLSLSGKGKAAVHKKIVCNDTEITTKTIIIATGAAPRKVGCEGEEKFLGTGIHFCALCDGAFYKDKDVIIIGGGNSAVEEVLYLSPIAKSIVVVNVMQKFTAFPYLVEKISGLKNVKIMHNTTMTKVIGNEKLSSIQVNTKTGDKDTTKTIKCDGVFVAIGRKPNTAFLNGAVELTANGYIVVNKKLETSVPGVYAAGDVSEKHVRQIVTACADGAIAATHAAEYVRGLKN